MDSSFSKTLTTGKQVVAEKALVENKIETVVSDHRKSGVNLGLVAYENELSQALVIGLG